MRKGFRTCMLLVAVTLNLTVIAHADEVTEWNKILFESVLAANTNPLVTSRVAAIVQASVFDAVNGIERRYSSIHVEPDAPRGASSRAAAVQAAYASLTKLYPAQKATLDVKLAASLAGISSGAAAEHSESIARGIEWGQAVADAIWDWRSTDGFTPNPPPFTGGNAVGQWRPTPPANAPGAGPQFAYMTPWVINSPSQFRPAGPPALASAEYTADFNETKSVGNLTSPLRTADQTLYSLFWNVSTASYYWNAIALSLSAERHLTLSENARLLALLDITFADAAIACWDAKYHYVFWRPVTAIPLAATDGNPATTEDANWMPLFATPAHPEYPSGHSTVSGSAGAVLASYFGDNSPFSVTSNVMLGVTRSYPSFSAALEEIKNARIYAGIHFRTACDHGQAVGIAVANYVLNNACQPIHGNHKGQLKD
jgi:membrane-associated phospholipid phosphatase